MIYATKYIIEGTEKELEILITKLEEWTKGKTESIVAPTPYLKNILAKNNIHIENKINEETLEKFSHKIHYKKNKNYIWLKTISEWKIQHDIWNIIIQKYTKNCKLYYRSVDIAEPYFYTNDTKEKYFKKKYYLIYTTIFKDKKNNTNNKNIAPYLHILGQYKGHWLSKKQLVKTLRTVFGKPKLNLKKLLSLVEEFNTNENTDTTIQICQRAF